MIVRNIIMYIRLCLNMNDYEILILNVSVLHHSTEVVKQEQCVIFNI